VGKTWIARELGKLFPTFLEVNFELFPETKKIFHRDPNRGQEWCSRPVEKPASLPRRSQKLSLWHSSFRLELRQRQETAFFTTVCRGENHECLRGAGQVIPLKATCAGILGVVCCFITVYIVIPDFQAEHAFRVFSPRLANPKQAIDFQKEASEVSSDAGL